MAISPEERARWDRQVEALREAELEEYEVASRETIAWLNAERARVGKPPLEEGPPEEGFYRRARELGLR